MPETQVVAIDFKKWFMKEAKRGRGRPRTGDVKKITDDLNRHYGQMKKLMEKSTKDWAKLSTPRLLASYYLLSRLALSEKKIYQKVNWTSNPQAAVMRKYVKPIIIKRLQTIGAATLKAAAFVLFSNLFKKLVKSNVDPDKLQKFIDALSLLYAVAPMDTKQFIDSQGKAFARAIAQKGATVVKAKRTVILMKLLKKYGLVRDIGPEYGKLKKRLAALVKIGERVNKLMKTEDVKTAVRLLDNIMKFIAAGGLDGVLKIVSGIGNIADAINIFKKRDAKIVLKVIPVSLVLWLKAFGQFIDTLLKADALATRSKPRKLERFRITKWSNPKEFERQLRKEGFEL